MSQWVPPQGQSAVVRSFRWFRRRVPNVAGVLAGGATNASLELTNAGTDEARALAVAVVDEAGAVVTAPAGHLHPGESVSVPIDATLARGDVRCVWTCLDRSGRTHIWSYDGRHVRAHDRPDPTTALARVYPAPAAAAESSS
ncbi:MAG TPA: hypothetical protein VMB53_12475 [Gaiellaceae bacterium]|nr:hypothetical protein [Gaiellaceae bacterium]